MFKEENRIWWYLLGVVVMMVLLLIFGRDYFIPVLTGERSLFDRYTYYSPPEMQISTQEDYFAVFNTSKGEITVDLYENAAPKNVNNFVFLARQDYYAGTKFHRIISDFLVQGGDRNTLDDDPDNDGRGNAGYFIDDELNWDALGIPQSKRQELAAQGFDNDDEVNSKPLERFSLAMANSGPDTNSSQFFFVTASTNDPRIDQLNGRFTAIGRVVSGGNNLLNIADTPVDDTNSQIPRPQEEIVLEQVQIVVN